MADKNQEYPFAPSNGAPRSDQESRSSSDELKRKKRIKLAIYVAVFVVFQILVITVFGLTVMKVKSPKLRLANIQFQTLNAESSTSSSPSFDMTFATRVTVKNPNFGRYKFENTTATFTYKGAAVGELFIAKGKAGMKSTKKVNAVVTLKSGQLPNAAEPGNELRAGTLTLSSSAKMKGKVELMLIMKKNKSADMNCTITIDVAAKAVKTLQCK